MPAIEGTEIEHRYVDLDGLRMHVAIAGPEDAEPVVLLHGWPQHWFMWRRMIGPLAERYRVYAPDLRGFGWTDAPRGEYLKRTLASDVVALLDELGLERVRLAGHDWGGFAGFLICLDAPERVSHFAAVAIAHPWVKPEPGIGAALQIVGRLSYQALLASPVLGGQLVQRVPAFTRTLMRGAAGDPDEAWSGNELEQFVSQWSEPDRARVTVAIYRSFLTKELRELASGGFADQTMQTPSILVAGSADPVIRPSGLAGFERNAPNLRLEVVKGAGHWIPEEAPEVLVQHLLELYEQPSPA